MKVEYSINCNEETKKANIHIRFIEDNDIYNIHRLLDADCENFDCQMNRLLSQIIRELTYEDRYEYVNGMCKVKSNGWEVCVLNDVINLEEFNQQGLIKYIEDIIYHVSKLHTDIEEFLSHDIWYDISEFHGTKLQYKFSFDVNLISIRVVSKHKITEFIYNLLPGTHWNMGSMIEDLIGHLAYNLVITNGVFVSNEELNWLYGFLDVENKYNNDDEVEAIVFTTINNKYEITLKQDLKDLEWWYALMACIKNIALDVCDCVIKLSNNTYIGMKI